MPAQKKNNRRARKYVIIAAPCGIAGRVSYMPVCGPGAADRRGNHRIASKLHFAIRRIHFFGKEVEASRSGKPWAPLGRPGKGWASV